VEVVSRGRTNLVASCLYPVERDLVVKTRSDTVDKIRKLILEFLLAHAPDSVEMTEMAKTYGADKNRFEKESMFCVLCGLCVRYCAEVKKKNVICFVDNGGKREINFIPELAAKECWDCKECYPLCPTSYLQAAYHLTEAIAFPWLSTRRLTKEETK
jgi:NADH dehydrogenase/NADH:ubiquinone oxidoreductase subunit G